MNGNVKCVENQGKNNECMHVKCKYVVIVVSNNSIGIKFHFYHLATMLGNFFCYTIDESVQTSSVVFSIQNLKGYVRKYQRSKQLML
jgi:hypothetical protein